MRLRTSKGDVIVCYRVVGCKLSLGRGGRESMQRSSDKAKYKGGRESSLQVYRICWK